MAARKRQVTGGVDTHGKTHHAAAVDQAGRILGDQEFPATTAGYQLLLAWLRGFGAVVKVGVEGTGTYGAGLARFLTARGIALVEVDRPDRRARRAKGKSDPLDALAAARAALSGQANGTPKTRTGPVEAIRALRVARRGAVKARTAALNQLHGLIASAPDTLRQELNGPATTLVNRCAALPVNETRLTDPVEATKAALAVIATRIQTLTTEINQADRRLRPVVARTAPHLSAVYGVGPDVAGQLLTTAGDNPDRLRSDAALAHLCGAAPIPASSGRTDRHRLNRGGDRAANSALHTIALVRMRYDPRTRAYVDKRTKQGLNKKEIMRCLKRYIVREVHTALLADFTALNTP
ncbi:IS110 family transposase [Micromonospora sp. WMMD1155]|uniref:IS110 family transposase n=1 Tax=Micromonospora sp. WMMD1155 TaxID=3016094 RepID=UPI00249BCDAC|nr:IS110 family transposase [Micromonospora sp. WMMD1155]WFE50153.1 IS110 family transposase [Micromonospora sp. WMMD1155]WFE50389.1 IS110 family transposase [Micromonospora sp. WMMD1155]WFE52767.1 IS110 family transposase [Micromonospora sp. WMMD1155]WFE53559.1 IS110 family transposase [Micromonospora sp. WMMD1155]WFE54250.1 IS110 family transposase [Micromonospora sp. WMMD1155]